MDNPNEKKPIYTYDQLKEKYIDKKPIENDKKSTTKDIADNYSMITSFFFTLIILIALGVFFGYWLDQRLHTTPLFIILLSFLGIAGAYRNLFKTATKNDKGSSNNDTRK